MIYPRESPVDLGGGKLQRRLYMDTMDDYPNLPGIDKAAPGSSVFCVETSGSYILNSLGAWVLASTSSPGDGGGSAQIVNGTLML